MVREMGSWKQLLLGLCLGFILATLVHQLVGTVLPAEKSGGEFTGTTPGFPGSEGRAATWDAETRAARMKELMMNVSLRAGEDVKADCLAFIEGGPLSLRNAWGQANEDWYLFHNYFFHVPYGQGKYIDIGSNHPRQFSNTFFFDRCLGWKGLCIEPNPSYRAIYPSYKRTCTPVPNCLAGKKMTASMDLGQGTLGNILPAGAGSAVECRPLTDILDEHGFSGAEFATIDIEGFEYKSLRCFPFQKYSIDTWLVEIDKGGYILPHLFLRAGYAQVQNIAMSLYHSELHAGPLLSAIFRRVDQPFIFGPSFLPGRPWEGKNPVGACPREGLPEDQCPHQMPVILRDLEMDGKNLSLFEGSCGYPKDVWLPLSEDPALVSLSISQSWRPYRRN